MSAALPRRKQTVAAELACLALFSKVCGLQMDAIYTWLLADYTSFLTTTCHHGIA